jgi:hypothetical protein
MFLAEHEEVDWCDAANVEALAETALTALAEFNATHRLASAWLFELPGTGGDIKYVSLVHPGFKEARRMKAQGWQITPLGPLAQTLKPVAKPL